MSTPIIEGLPDVGRRVRSLARAELILLRRNRTALVNAILPPLAIGALAVPGRPALLTAVVALVLVSVVYYTLVGTYVARREDLVLKRLRVGELTDGEILAGTAVPAVVLAIGQILLLVGVGAVFLGPPGNPLLLVLGVLAGAVVFALLAAASAIVTRTVELAQVTTLPIVLACLAGSGLLVPVDDLPFAVLQGLRFLPLTPVLELVRLGWLSTDGFLADLRAAAVPTGILLVWGFVGVVVVRRWFRWEPRR
jgi:ABC-2 type transport system permease protein